MATPSTPTQADPTVTDMLELDLPVTPTAPALPMWANQAIQRINAATSRPQIAAIIEPLRAQPEGPGKAAVRAAMNARADQLAAPAATRQAIPTVKAPTALDVLVVLWITLWRSLGDALVMRPPVAAPVAAPVTRAIPRNGTWTKLRMGPRRGDWGARIPSATAPVGSFVRLHRSNGTVTLHRVESIAGTGTGVVYAAVGDELPESALETQAAPAFVQALADAWPATSEPETIGESTQEPSGNSSTAALARELGGIAAEGAANAEGLDLAQGGVQRSQVNSVAGFNSPEAYALAARNAVTQATRDHYISMARAGGIEIDPATLPPITVTQGAGTSAGITHTPTGPSIFDRPKSERVFKVGETKTAAEVKAILNGRNLIAGAVAEGSPVQISWTGGGTTTVEAVKAALAEIGRENDAPGGPSSVRHAGRAVEAMRNRELDTARLPTGDLPDGVKARWMIGRKLDAGKAVAGQAYGTALLIVSLTDGDALTFDGDATLAAAIAGDYSKRVAKETLRSEDLTAWLGLVLKHAHHAVKRGPHYYVPGGQAAAARLLSETIGKLWGDHDQISVTTGPDLVRSIARGLTDEIGAVMKAYTTALDAARDTAEAKALAEAGKAKRIPTDEETRLARSRATVSATVAARLVTDLAKVATRVGGYEILLGEKHSKLAKTQIAALRAVIEPLTDDTALFAANWELS